MTSLHEDVIRNSKCAPTRISELPNVIMTTSGVGAITGWKKFLHWLGAIYRVISLYDRRGNLQHNICKLFEWKTHIKRVISADLKQERRLWCLRKLSTRKYKSSVSHGKSYIDVKMLSSTITIPYDNVQSQCKGQSIEHPHKYFHGFTRRYTNVVFHG